jgi:pSer/pThr/pTyr-binding forkhead associated (FHA) protein
MEAEMRILGQAHMNTRVPVRLGQTLTVGRSAPADVILDEDSLLSSPHFTVRVDDLGCWLTDLGSLYGTFVNGRRVSEAFVPDGSTIAAGSTTFLLFLTHRGEPVHDLPEEVRGRGIGRPAAPAPSVLEALAAVSEPLFVLLDAARSYQVLEVLRPSGEQYQSLYEGPEGDELADWAPYLVALPTGSPLRETLVREGWGQSWGVYLTCPLPFAEVRKHFRKFLLVKSQEDGRTLYFRFYDPRVLRLFLPTCNATETAEFFGPIREFLSEAADPGSLLRFTRGARGAEQATMAVSIEPSTVAPR